MGRADAFSDWTTHTSADLTARARSHALPRPRPAAVAGDGRWRAAAARVDLSRPLFGKPAGWSTRAEAATGWIGHRFARLALLQAPDGERLLVGGLDALAASRFLVEGLGRALAPQGLDVGRIWLGATHAHTAMGAVFGDLYYDSLASDILAGFDALEAEWLLERLTRGVIALEGALEPVQVGAGEGLLRFGSLWQRALGPFLAQRGDPAAMTHARALQLAVDFAPPGWARPQGARPALDHAALLAVDPRVPTLRLTRPDGRLLFALSTVHATSTLLSPGVALHGADALGAAAGFVEARHPDAVVAVVAGACGDVNLTDPDQPVDAVLRTRLGAGRSLTDRRRRALRYVSRCGAVVAEAIDAALLAATDEANPALALRFAEAFAPGAEVARDPADTPVGASPPPPGPRALPEDWSIGRAVTGGSEFSQPKPPEPLVALAPRPDVDWDSPHGPRNALFALRGVYWPGRGQMAYPPFLPVRVVSIGRTTLVGLPAEPSVALAAIVRAALPQGVAHVGANVGAFTGYADTIGAFVMQEYEGASSAWGRDLGVFLAQQVRRLLSATAFSRVGGAPAADAWLVGGRLGRGEAVGGVARFTLGTRATRRQAYGPGRPLAPRPARFGPDAALGGAPGATGVAVVASWTPPRAAVPRSRREDASWPRPATDGPVVHITLQGGGVLSSDRFPMLVRWEAGQWHVHAELPEPPVSLRVTGSLAALPHGGVIPYAP